MTSREKLFFFIITFKFLVANIVPLEFSFVPKINCNDLNKNGYPDFIVLSDIDYPQNIYHLELKNNKIEILWQYKKSDKENGYFVDILFNDFNGDGKKELIATAYQNDNKDIFYIFNTDSRSIKNTSPIITKLKNTRFRVNNPSKLYHFQDDQSLFVLVQGSPNRKVVLCQYIDDQIVYKGILAENFINSTKGPVHLALGDFDGLGNQDIFILNNDFQPSGYFIFSNGFEEKINLDNYPRLKLLNSEGVDINFDGKDDLVFINRNGDLMSNIWLDEAVSLSERSIQNISVNAENGFIYLNTISKSGKIGNYSIDPLTKNILSSDFELSQFANNYDKSFGLILFNKIIVANNSELWVSNVINELISDVAHLNYTQHIYDQDYDYYINVGDIFQYNIEIDNGIDFINFKEIDIPEGMQVDIDNFEITWEPKINQLGYHKFSFKLVTREKGSLNIDISEGKKIIRRIENEYENQYDYLVYVNDSVQLGLMQNNQIIVNKELFEWIIPIYDDNADAKLDIYKISGHSTAQIKIIDPKISLTTDTLNIPLDTLLSVEVTDTLNIPLDTLLSVEVTDTLNTPLDTLLSVEVTDTLNTPLDTLLSVETIGITNIDSISSDIINSDKNEYVDSVKTEFEEFTDKKIKMETDPLKQKKLSQSDSNFKDNEAQYREKLKTHKKVLKDGKNVWVPIDTLKNSFENISLQDSIIIQDTSIIIIDTLQNKKNENLDNIIIEKPPLKYLKKVAYNELVEHQAIFKWYPNVKPGDYQFIISISDLFTIDTVNFTITVHPEIDLTSNSTEFIATIDKVFTTQVILEQYPRSDKFIYELIDAPENMKIDNYGNINWVPIPTQVDNYSFKVLVTDQIAENIINYNIYVNAPPVISSRPPPVYYVSENEEMTFQLESFDLNKNNLLQWKLISGPDNMILSPDGQLSWPKTKLGHSSYTIQLSDGIDSVRYSAIIYVNSAPEITSTPIKVVTKGNSYKYEITAWDANKMSPSDSLKGNNISYSLIQGPDELVLNDKILYWNTKSQPLGEYMVAIAASDGIEEDIQVFPIFINSLPIVKSSDSIIVELGESLEFKIEAEDKNTNDILTYHIDPLLGDLQMDLYNGIIRWNPIRSDLGVNIFKLQVKDGHDHKGTIMPLKIFVYDLPKLTSDLAAEAFTGIEYTAFITASDMNGEKLNEPESILIESASFQNYSLSKYAHLFKWTPRDIDKGNHEIIIKITDNFGFITLHKHNLTVFSNPCMHCDNKNSIPADSTKN